MSGSTSGLSRAVSVSSLRVLDHLLQRVVIELSRAWTDAVFAPP